MYENEYDLFLAADLNDRSDGGNLCQWFYFAVWGVEPGVSYKFNIVNFKVSTMILRQKAGHHNSHRHYSSPSLSAQLRPTTVLVTLIRRRRHSSVPESSRWSAAGSRPRLAALD